MAAEPQPSATVVLLRDARDAPEVLLLQRAPRRDGKPGPWVFPGGKVERDEAQRSGGDVLAAAREAAVRETAEELVTFRPRICPQEDGACILYPGDAGYELGDPLVAGPRHRLWSLPGGYRYERER
jgi:ADP-ribose pyrophosphatase YjhB (NUDIX family)